MLSYMSLCAWFTFSIFSYASVITSGSQTALLRSGPTLNPSVMDSAYVRQSRVDDIIVLSRRDLPSDGLATSVPLSANGSTAKFHPEDRDLLLRSSSHNVSGIDGYRLYTAPIFANELTSLLTDTRADLLNLNSNAMTHFYQFNTTKWSFSVAAPNITLHYASIQAIVSRFLKLSSSRTPSDITSTRVGVVFNGNETVADVNITPCPAIVNRIYVPFANFNHDHNTSSPKPTNITKITPFGRSCSYETINETTALAPFLYPPTTQNLTARGIEHPMLTRVGQTLFALSMRIWQGPPDGHPVKVEMWIIEAIALIALSQISFEAMLCAVAWQVLKSPKYHQQLEERVQHDTGFYVLGKMAARLVLQITERDSQGQLIWLKTETWIDLISKLIVPLQQQVGEAGGMMGLHQDGWAMEGEMFGPKDGDEDIGKEGLNDQVAIGRWQLWIGDSGN